MTDDPTDSSPSSVIPITRALTLWQPMAWAISDSTKRIENRSWKPWLGTRRIAIHAGTTYDVSHAEQILEAFGIVVPKKKDIPLSAIVAVVDVVGHVTDHPSPWFSGPVGWLLENVVKLPTPVPCSGARQLWTIPAAERAQVNAMYNAEVSKLVAGDRIEVPRG